MAGGGRGRGKEELRSWMTAKRRERLAQFVAEKDRLRKREKHPFQPPPSVRIAAVKIQRTFTYNVHNACYMYMYMYTCI